MNDVDSGSNLSSVRRGPKFVVQIELGRLKIGIRFQENEVSDATSSFLVLAIHFENRIVDVTSTLANGCNRVVGATTERLHDPFARYNVFGERNLETSVCRRATRA